MRRAPVAVLGLIGAVAVMNLVFTGCGSEDTPAITDATDSGDEGASANEAGDNDATGSPDTSVEPSDAGDAADGFINAITDGGRADAADCKPVAQTCATSGDCCSANCNATTHQCTAPVNACKASGVACVTGNECCTFSCIGGTCSTKQCVADNLACATDPECCGGKCAPNGAGGGTCTPLNGGGPATSGNPCTTNAGCASSFCNNGICTNPSFCAQTGDVCSTGGECCGGVCTIAAGNTLGLCSVATASGAGNCLNAGIVCPQTMPPALCGGQCCSKSCAPYAPTGVDVCQPESGCRVTGSICMKDNDCCGALGSPGSTKAGSGNPANVKCSIAAGSTVGRCTNGNACSPAGNICRLATLSCSATDTCCAGNVQQHPLNCKQDALGIPRCTAASDYDCSVSGPPAVGTGCASTADCCGNPCVPNPAGAQPAFVCGAPGSCVASGGTCSSTADCCAGFPCAISPGSSKGICGGTVLGDGGVAPPPDGGGVPVTSDGGTADSGTVDAGGASVCALYGQMCAQSSDCCSAVPCTGGTCHYP
jgi:hypothetical protein